MASLIGLFATGIPALVLGVCALNDIRREQRFGTLKGRGLAIVGVTLGGALSSAIFVGPIALARFQRAAFSPPQTVSPLPDSIADNVIPIVPHGARWRWLHPIDGVDPARREPAFHERFHALDYDDSHWQKGAESNDSTGFGYGDPVAVPIGTPTAGARHTAYFRARFRTLQPFTGLIFACYRDDGIIIYIDGKEVGRDNMPDEPETYHGSATEAIAGGAETAMIGITIPGGLPPGDHVLAISVHNASTDSSDLRLGNVRLYGTR